MSLVVQIKNKVRHFLFISRIQRSHNFVITALWGNCPLWYWQKLTQYIYCLTDLEPNVILFLSLLWCPTWSDQFALMLQCRMHWHCKQGIGDAALGECLPPITPIDPWSPVLLPLIAELLANWPSRLWFVIDLCMPYEQPLQMKLSSLDNLVSWQGLMLARCLLGAGTRLPQLVT